MACSSFFSWLLRHYAWRRYGHTKHLVERFELYRYLKKTLLVGVDVEADFLSTKGAAVTIVTAAKSLTGWNGSLRKRLALIEWLAEAMNTV